MNEKVEDVQWDPESQENSHPHLIPSNVGLCPLGSSLIHLGGTLPLLEVSPALTPAPDLLPA